MYRELLTFEFYMNIYQNIVSAKKENRKLLAVLIDPEKIAITTLSSFLEKVDQSIATHIFVGGSTDKNNQTEKVVDALKKRSSLPIVLFPGDVHQITDKADGILFLSLLSGRNPEYLIEQHIKAAPILQQTKLEIIPRGYILIDGGNETTVQRISKTSPISQHNIDLILSTALAGEFSGKKLIYLEAGSGAKIPISKKIIKKVSKNLTIPLLIGGGIKTKQQLETAFNAGADLVVIGTAFEKDDTFLNDLKK